MKPKLDRITLLCLDTFNYGGAVSAIKKSMEQCEFAAVKFLTNIPIKVEGVEVVQLEQEIRSKEDYSHFCIKELYKHFDTDFVLVVQHDGYVLSSKAWMDEFMDYDYIAPPWLYTDGKNVGCGGFSLRSHKLQRVLSTDSFIFASDPEDQAIGRLYRDYLIKKYDIKFPSEDLADKFGFELRVPIQDTFGFHGKFHEKYRPTVIVRRMEAMGDCVQVEPVLQYFHDKGYKVILDTLPQFQILFLNHYFKVHNLKYVDQREVANARIVNLDMSYESNPKQLHLKTYFEYAGVPEEEYTPYLKNPTLSIGFVINEQTKLFKKYCVFHVDNRPQPGRNVYNVNWEAIAREVQKLGYTPIQVGRDTTATIPNALQVNCTNENFLCYLVGGADLMIGIDSGISHIASAFKVPSVILFGSVDPNVIHADLSDKEIIHLHGGDGVCDKPFCWGSVIGTEGVECYIDKAKPPCTQFTTDLVLDSLNKLINRI